MIGWGDYADGIAARVTRQYSRLGALMDPVTDRLLVIVADSSYAVLELLDRCVTLSSPITMVTRLRLDAALYEPAPSRQPGDKGRPRTAAICAPAYQIKPALRPASASEKKATLKRIRAARSSRT